MPPESTGQQDLRTYARILWRWKFLFLFFVIVMPVGTYFLEQGKPKTYQSSALLSVQGSVAGAGQIAPDNIAAVARLVTTTPIAGRAALFLKVRPANAASLLTGVSATSDPSTGFITITVQAPEPQRAAAVADAFARALGGYQTHQAIHTINLQLRTLVNQLAGIARKDAASRASLVTQIAQLRAQRGGAGAGAQIVQPPVASFTPVGPQTRRSVEIALVIALLLGAGAVLVAENSDRRLRSPEDLEVLTKMPLLGTVPSSAFRPDGDEIPGDVEAFQMLRASLTYFNVERPLSSVAIISPLVADGKTTVAVGLAIAVARAGKRAILIDADLRRPQVCTRLGIDPTAGLGAVLSGEAKLSQVMLECSVDAPPGGRLLVLPANLGPLPPNPSALTSSKEMMAVLRELEGQADLVIVDTAAALAVSDALPLLQTASGVVLIVRMNRSSRAAVRRLQKVIASSHGHVLGVVATGIASTAAGYDKYGYYAQNGKGSGRRRRLRFKRHRKRKTTTVTAVTAVPPAASSANGSDAPGFEPAAGRGDVHRDDA